MAKKDHTLGKLLALTTTVAVIGGACYIFRDKIQQSAIYRKSKDKLSGLIKKSDDFDDDDDFFFDDEDDVFDDDTIFSEDSRGDREYTSITINSKQEEDDTHNSPLPEAEPEATTPVEAEPITPVITEDDTLATAEEPSNEESSEEMTEVFAEDTIPTISFGGTFSTPVSTPEPPTTIDSDSVKEQTEDTVSGYEYEGLSDVSEDPDVLEEQDKLDF